MKLVSAGRVRELEIHSEDEDEDGVVGVNYQLQIMSNRIRPRS